MQSALPHSHPQVNAPSLHPTVMAVVLLFRPTGLFVRA